MASKRTIGKMKNQLRREYENVYHTLLMKMKAEEDYKLQEVLESTV